MTADLDVSLGERSYPIRFGSDLSAAVRAKVEELRGLGRPVAVVTDGHVESRQPAALEAMFGAAPIWIAPPGESTKSLAEFGRLLDFFASSRLDRTAAVFAVGGGVIGDLAGYAAASYLRGIDYFQVPTSLLAMVDSSVGGKTGINLAAGKNLVGAFHQPRGVYIATGLLATLPAREFAAGMAEVIKYGLLGDAELFAALERSPLTVASPELPAVIRRCCVIKADIVAADERELAPEGGRALLNLGHTFAHAIEHTSGYGVYLHGEAVAIGLAAAARLSRQLGGIDDGTVARIDAVLMAHGLPARLRSALPLGHLMAATGRDKKVRAGERRFVVLRALGAAATQGGIDPALAEQAFRAIGAV
jgi:3-dehydroquinate synthase